MCLILFTKFVSFSDGYTHGNVKDYSGAVSPVVSF